ncbi:MAG TPA: DUF4352 domain-containing protein [Thermomicrobiaceae bacterium]|nr:DUF4352 domain-containing protein [Thermomicrobiaceae bacterium]
MRRLVIIVLCALALTACGGAGPASLPGVGVAGSPQAVVLHPIGSPVPVGQVVVTINGISEPTGGQGTRPQPGQMYIAVDLTLENDSGSVTDISTVVMMSVRDSTGHVYRPNVTATNVATGSQDTMDGPLVPTQPVRGKVGFQVPAGAHGLVFQFQSTLNGPITAFDLQH